MATTSKYIVLGSDGDGSSFIDYKLDYGTLSLDGQDIQFLGSSFVDALFVRPGATYSLSTGGGADRIYFGGSLADYTLTRSGATLTLSRTVGVKVETVNLAGANSATTPDVLVFADGAAAANAVYNHVSKGDPLPVPAGETSLNPAGAAAPGANLSSTVKVVSFDATGETIALSAPGVKFQVLGNAGTDVVYVADGATVDATALGGGTDVVYFRGHWSDYAKSVTGTRMTFTRNVGDHVETVIVSAGGNTLNDQLVFADGAVRSQVAGSAVKLDANVALSALSGYDAVTVTPGLDIRLQSTLDGVTELDVRSNLVFTSSETLALTAADGTYHISVVNDANSTAKAGYSGTLGEAVDHTQTLEVTVAGGVVTASWNGVAVNLADVLTFSDNKLTINPLYDLDLSNNYHVEIDAGLIVSATSGLTNAAYVTGGFSTVTPNTVGTGAALVTGATQSYMMGADGALMASYKWVGIDGVGNTAVAAPTSIGSLSGGGIALAATDRQAGSNIGTWDFWVRATDFGADDFVYLDNQENGVAGWDLANTYFQSGDTFPNDTRVDFGTYNGAAPFPNSSQSYLDLDIGGGWRETPADVASYLNSTTPVFAGG
ncbi:hypothetical protein AEB_P2987 [Altererythrobacter sp. B11]|uniref:hypothetical protein n=1 Tax=Altererythrobacter sp. B11 TaxID=2060312 RepID=UPI000DC735FE|nr:hypothetical protein [Altererythrobacter sp. B11]BBC73855.1 hypothetical protein AEB_P2987 [Altererythrobacter sp. B11]